MPQLMAEQAPSGAALKVSFPFLSILPLGVSFVTAALAPKFRTESVFGGGRQQKDGPIR
jgi:hypothetical protein